MKKEKRNFIEIAETVTTGLAPFWLLRNFWINVVNKEAGKKKKKMNKINREKDRKRQTGGKEEMCEASMIGFWGIGERRFVARIESLVVKNNTNAFQNE
jgi:hypothetical protein